MVKKVALQEFLDLIHEALEMEDDKLTLEDGVDTVEEWDSLGHLSIIAALDSLGIDTEKDEYRSFDTIAKLVELVKMEGVIGD